jgi:hypothetical protein
MTVIKQTRALRWLRREVLAKEAAGILAEVERKQEANRFKSVADYCYLRYLKSLNSNYMLTHKKDKAYNAAGVVTTILVVTLLILLTYLKNNK